MGGSQGVVAAARVRPEIGPDTARLKVNRLLNMSGTRGRGAGNALGVLGLLFAGMESGLGYLNDGAIPDSAATVTSGKSWPLQLCALLLYIRFAGRDVSFRVHVVPYAPVNFMQHLPANCYRFRMVMT